MTFPKGLKISLIGYGASNKAMCEYLMKNGIYPTIRCDKSVCAPNGCELITQDYLNTYEDIIFRSPVIRPDKIKGNGRVFTEASYALEITNGAKIGISGSDGKTTTSSLIYSALIEDAKKATLCGNIGTPIIESAPASTPDSYTVCELSSFQLMDMLPTLDVAVLTNITENHLDWHKNMHEYIEAKKNILLRARSAVLCYDNPALRDLSPSAPVTYFTRGEMPKNTGAEHLVYVKNEDIYYDGEKVIALDALSLKGEFNILNAEATIGALLPVVEKDAIRRALSTFEGVESRMKCIKIVRGVSFIDSSIDSTPSRTLATLSAFDKSRCVLILGGYDKGLSYECLSALEGIKCAIICGANAQKIHKAIAGSCKCLFATDFEMAVRRAYSEACEGDFVILSPASASFDMFESYKKRADAFKKIVGELK
ncbi:MAG: UDP-N-acetylmuramoyl-L-alanine--D-glutamate ligase [Clostridia bacterium]|nr:UDP-N-acetylmuramoyl-L-alanine--D-glutamate ligase [Clostridia bacterium]